MLAGIYLPENLPCGDPTKYMVPFCCAPLHCCVVLSVLSGESCTEVARSSWSYGSVPLNSSQASWQPTGNKACVFPVERLQKMWEGQKPSHLSFSSSQLQKKEASNPSLLTINMGSLLFDWYQTLFSIAPEGRAPENAMWQTCLRLHEAVPAVHTIPLLGLVCIPSFSLCIGPAPQSSWEQRIHHHADQWAGSDTAGLGGWVKASGFYIITDLPENACQIPRSLTQLSMGFPHLVLQSLEIRSVKCHRAFNVAYLQIVWTRLLLSEKQHVSCECSACSKTPWNTQQNSSNTQGKCGAAKDLCAFI